MNIGAIFNLADLGLTDTVILLLSTAVTICYLSSSIILIRTIIIVTEIGYFFLALYTGLDQPGMTGMLIVSIFNTTINGLKIVQYYYENSTRCLPKDLHTLYLTEFDLLTPKEFKLLHQWATKEEKGGILIGAGKRFEKLMFVLDGAPLIRLEKGKIIKLSMSDGSTSIWLGEMSFLGGGEISAEVLTEPGEKVKLLTWTKDDIDKLKVKHPVIVEKLRYIIATNLAEKIRFTNTLIESRFSA